MVVYPKQRNPSMLFHHRTKTVLKWIWIALSVLIILSMVFAYSGGAIF